MFASFAGQTKESIEKFKRFCRIGTWNNPIPYNFLVMSLEFDEDSPEEKRKILCERWVELAEKSGNTTQMLRAQNALKRYGMTPEERKEAWKHG